MRLPELCDRPPIGFVLEQALDARHRQLHLARRFVDGEAIAFDKPDGTPTSRIAGRTRPRGMLHAPLAECLSVDGTEAHGVPQETGRLLAEADRADQSGSVPSTHG